MANPQDPNRIVVSGRASFLHVAAPKAVQGSEPKYSVNILMDKKTDAASIARIQKVIDALVAEKWKGKRPPADKLCLKDGSVKEDKDGYGPDIMFLSASNAKQPDVYSASKVPLEPKSKGYPYSGCYCNFVIRLWAQDNQYGKRINAELLAVQFVKDGDAFGAGAPVDTAADLPDVEEVEDEV